MRLILLVSLLTIVLCLFELVKSDIEYAVVPEDDAVYNTPPGDFSINKGNKLTLSKLINERNKKNKSLPSHLEYFNCSTNASKLWDYFKSGMDTNQDGLIDKLEIESFLSKMIQ